MRCADHWRGHGKSLGRRCIALPEDDPQGAAGLRTAALASRPPSRCAPIRVLIESCGKLARHAETAVFVRGWPMPLRRREEQSDGAVRSWRDRSDLSDEAWQAVKRAHARLLRAAGAERFVLDRLCLEDDAPLSSEVERVRAALERVGMSHPTY